MTLTLQEAFDINWKHFVVNKQGPGWNPETRTCQYKAPNGCRCAIGVCLPDNVLEDVLKFEREDDEGDTSISRLIDNIPSVENLFTGIDSLALESLQDDHDILACSGPEVFKGLIQNKLRRFGENNHLLVPAE